MEEVKIIATNLKNETEFSEDNFLSVIYEEMVSEVRFNTKHMIKNNGIYSIEIDETISINASIEFEQSDFNIDISIGTYDNNYCIIYLTIHTEDTYEHIEDKLYQLKIGVKDFLIKSFKEIYWQKDTQNVKICSGLYSKIHKTENEFREIINDYMVKVHGEKWFEKVNPLYQKKAEQFSTWYKSHYSVFNNIQSELFNLQVIDLIGVLKSSYINVIDHKIIASINELVNRVGINTAKLILKEDYIEFTSIWDKEFKDVFGTEFEEEWNDFSFMRNMVAHNKPICANLYQDIINAINSFELKFIHVEKEMKRIISEEEASALKKINKYTEEFYFEEAGLNGIPTEEEVLEEINENTTIDNLITSIKGYCDSFNQGIDSICELFSDVLDSIDLSNIKVSKEALSLLNKLINERNLEKQRFLDRLIASVTNRNSLLIIMDELRNHINDATLYFNSLTLECNCEDGIKTGTVCKIKDLHNNCLELVVKGDLSPTKGFMDNLLLILIENGIESEDYGSIEKHYCDYETDESHIASPTSSDELYIDIDIIQEHIVRFINRSNSLFAKWIQEMEKYI